MQWPSCFAAALVALAASRSARADSAPPAAAPPGVTPSGVSLPGPVTASGAPFVPAEPREIPDYDGRGRQGSQSPGFLWVPRVVFFPLYVVTEYVFRRPIGYAVRGAERAGIAEFLAAKSDYLLFPTVVADFGFRSSIGLYTGVNNLFTPGHEIRMRVAYGGNGFLKLKAKDRYVFDHGRQRLGIFGSYRNRSDDTFGGIGPDIHYNRDTVGRFSTRITDGGVRYDYGLESPTNFEIDAMVRDVRFGTNSCCGPSLADQVARGEVAAPPGFAAGFFGIHEQIIGSVDSRRTLASRGPWVRGEVYFGADVSLQRPGSQRWTNYGGEFGGGIAFPQPHQRLQLSVAAQFADQLDKDPIPLTGLVRFGGDRYMRGFGGDALYGNSGLVATLKYTWPVWLALDGTLHVAAGNTFGSHLQGFDPDKLRLSFGPGLSTNAIDDNKMFDLMVAFGTDTFQQGTRIASVRVAFGITEGF